MSVLAFKSTGTTTLSWWRVQERAIQLYYSFDNSTWTEWQWDYNSEFANNNYFEQKTIENNQTLYVSGIITEGRTHPYPEVYFQFSTGGTGTLALSGDIKALSYYWNSSNQLVNERFENYQYFNLFRGCNNIVDASNLVLPDLSAKRFCYANMFMDCSNLSSPPQISATTLDDWCYSSMFGGCLNLRTAPVLLATETKPYCYYGMFYGCKSLTTSPHLSATTLADWCYNSMFFGCTALTSITSDFTDWNTSGNATKNWVTGIDTIGPFINQNAEQLYGDDNIPNGWYVTVDQSVPLTFKSNGNNTLSASPFWNMQSFSYKKNNNEWTQYNNDVLVLQDKDTVSFSGMLNDSISLRNLPPFTTTGEGTVEVYGNVLSLNNYNKNGQAYNYNEFYGMFCNCQNLVDASKLNIPLSTISGTNQNDGFVCGSMFSGCTQLTAAPNILPTITIGRYAYSDMFRGCTSLKKSPIIAATNISDCSFFNMFYGCSSLSSININFTDWGRKWVSPPGTLVANATLHWIYGVAENGVFIKPKELEVVYSDAAQNDDSYVPWNWTITDK